MNDKFVDEVTSLAYYGARYYDPTELTWTQSDPKYRCAPDGAWKQPRRALLYSFVGGNPLRYLDPDGLDTASDVLEFLGSVALGSGTTTVLNAANDANPNMPTSGRALGTGLVAADKIAEKVVDNPVTQAIDPVNHAIKAGVAVNDAIGAAKKGDLTGAMGKLADATTEATVTVLLIATQIVVGGELEARAAGGKMPGGTSGISRVVERGSLDGEAGGVSGPGVCSGPNSFCTKANPASDGFGKGGFERDPTQANGQNWLCSDCWDKTFK